VSAPFCDALSDRFGDYLDIRGRELVERFPQARDLASASHVAV
jgi:hypothetical protein